jgi:hypothetical protein
MGRRPYQLTIDTFTTAVGAAFGLRDRFTHGHGAAVLDGRGRVLDLTVFAADHHSVDTALGWADCAVRNDARARRIVIISAVTDSVAGELRGADLDALRRARQTFASLGVAVVDWLQCDGENVRSLDLASGGEGWRWPSPVAS